MGDESLWLQQDPLPGLHSVGTPQSNM